MVGLEAKKQVAAYVLKAYKISERWAFEIVALRRRFGYRRIFCLLKREGFNVNKKKVYRIYRTAGLSVHRRKNRKKARGSRQERQPVLRPNQRWSLDYVFDQLSDGRKIKLMTLIDEFTRECLAVRVERSIKGADVIKILNEVIDERGKPEQIQSDNGSEFTSNAVLSWVHSQGIDWRYIEPGKPVQNSHIESFNGKIRDKCLNENWFETLNEAKVLIEIWRKGYNEIRPHGALNGLSPSVYAEEVRRKFEKTG